MTENAIINIGQYMNGNKILMYLNYVGKIICMQFEQVLA